MISARIAFDPSRDRLLREQWSSEQVNPWLRAVLVVLASFYAEQGARKMSVLKLLGNTLAEVAGKASPHAYGLAADVSIVEISDRRGSFRSSFLNGHEFPKPRWIEQRMNLLFPFADGRKRTVDYVVAEAHLHVEVPLRGYGGDSLSLASWQELGVTADLAEPNGRRLAV